MAYCVAADVQALLQQNTFDNSGDTQPTLSQVNKIIDQRTAEIDNILRLNGYSLPITDATTLKLLEQYCSYGSACTVGMTYFGNNDTVNDSQPVWFCNEYKDFIKELKESPETLIPNGGQSLIISNQVLDGTQTEAEFDDLQIKQEFKW